MSDPVGPTPGVAWYDDWYMGTPFLCVILLAPGWVFLFAFKTTHWFDNPAIYGLSGLYLIFSMTFSAFNASETDVKANFCFLLYSICGIASTIMLFASRFHLLGLVDVMHGGKSVHDVGTSLYFAVITWTTVGYGDIAPPEAARIYAASEALFGYLFMALIIVQLINISRTGAVPPSSLNDETHPPVD